MKEFKYFFSYARADTEFVLKLAKKLRAAGVNLWLDQLDILGGQHWDRAVEEALENCQGVIVVLSPDSLASNNVMDEVSYVLEERKLVVPVLFRPCNIPFRLRRVQHIDFKTDYNTGFSQLLRALRMEQPLELTRLHQPEKQVAQEVEELLAETPTEIEETERKPQEAQTKQRIVTQPVPAGASRTTTQSKRRIGALAGFGAGVAFPMIIGVFFGAPAYLSPLAIITGPIGAIAGAMCGTGRRVIKATMVGFLVTAVSGAIICSIFSIGPQPIAVGILLGGLLGVIGGAIVGMIIKKREGMT